MCLVERRLVACSDWGWGDRLSTYPSPAASSATTAGTLEEEGFFNVVSVHFGGGRIGTFLLTVTRSSSEGEGQALLLTMSASSLMTLSATSYPDGG